MSVFQELNVSIVPLSPKFSSANLEVEEEEEQATELSTADVPKYRLFANNSLLVSSLDADDIRAYKCHVRYPICTIDFKILFLHTVDQK